MAATFRTRFREFEKAALKVKPFVVAMFILPVKLNN